MRHCWVISVDTSRQTCIVLYVSTWRSGSLETVTVWLKKGSKQIVLPSPPLFVQRNSCFPHMTMASDVTSRHTYLKALFRTKKINGHNDILLMLKPGPWFSVKMSSYQYRKSQCGDKTVVRSSYLHNGISYTGKMTSLYWIRALVYVSKCSFPHTKIGHNEILVKLKPEYFWENLGNTIAADALVSCILRSSSATMASTK